MTKKILPFITNPYWIALLLSMFVIWVMPDLFKKYKIELTERQVCGSESRIYFEDLDGDGKSERIESQNNSFDNASLLLYDAKVSLIDQFNLEGKHLNATKQIHFQDTDGDHIKEVYMMTLINDSIYLNYKEGLQNKNQGFERVFVDRVAQYKALYDINYIFINENPKRPDKVYFAINMGFGGSTRSLFYFDTKTKTIHKSPHLTNATTLKAFKDIDGDQKSELFLSSNSSGNTIDSIYTERSDYSTWLSVLDHKLQFKFDPIEFKALGSVMALPVNLDDETFIVSVFKSRQYDVIPSQLILLSVDGCILKTKPIPDSNYNITLKLGDNIGVFNRATNALDLYNYDFESVKSLILQDVDLLRPIDTNEDGIDEWIGLHSDYQTATLYQANFEDGVTFNYSNKMNYPMNYGTRTLDTGERELYFQKLNSINLFNYQSNPLYHLKYLVYLGIYGACLGLVFLIIQGQKLREARSKKLEDEIAELQLKTIKNQVDPHFVFNAVNTLGELNLMDNKLVADQFIVEFSDFMRNTLSESDKISTSLETEIKYVENYLRLQQIRLNNTFNYSITVATKVNQQMLIPKHALYTYVENAIKYGLTNPDNNNYINIDISEDKDCILLEVKDNGLGLGAIKDPSKSTGSGLGIMSQIFALYQARFKYSITHSLTSITDENNTVKGTRAQVKICSKKRH